MHYSSTHGRVVREAVVGFVGLGFSTTTGTSAVSRRTRLYGSFPSTADRQSCISHKLQQQPQHVWQLHILQLWMGRLQLLAAAAGLAGRAAFSCSREQRMKQQQLAGAALECTCEQQQQLAGAALGASPAAAAAAGRTATATAAVGLATSAIRHQAQLSGSHRLQQPRKRQLLLLLTLYALADSASGDDVNARGAWQPAVGASRTPQPPHNSGCRSSSSSSSSSSQQRQLSQHRGHKSPLAAAAAAGLAPHFQDLQIAGRYGAVWQQQQ